MLWRIANYQYLTIFADYLWLDHFVFDVMYSTNSLQLKFLMVYNLNGQWHIGYYLINILRSHIWFRKQPIGQATILVMISVEPCDRDIWRNNVVLGIESWHNTISNMIYHIKNGYVHIKLSTYVRLILRVAYNWIVMKHRLSSYRFIHIDGKHYRQIGDIHKYRHIYVRI